ncbi:dockerin type I domain-containing protein [Candidatus Laterigemmans baculatus]|uniref:dockerin type I domain-containing protein n=1 Tax=Candidatus Laterigemmans baculatus TaxID=2770505 RepID=UPI0013DD78F1|nr:dockerin type I domain-containing protein [Candidatus Laterigemmans baculatus]
MKRAPERNVHRHLRLEALESRQLLAAVVMSDLEQLAIELINRARMDPVAEAERHGIDLNEGIPRNQQISAAPKQPLAPHQALVDAAIAHSQDMLDRDYFEHVNPDGDQPGDRMAEAGYSYRQAGENISLWSIWPGFDVDNEYVVSDHRDGLFLSPGHRLNTLNGSFKEIGVGVRHGLFTEHGEDWSASLLTENYGSRSGNSFITGVAYSDQEVEDEFYSVGEGWGDVTISAVEQSSGRSYSTQTGPSGGYSLQVPNGVYTVLVGEELLRQPIEIRNVQVNGENRKVDVVFTEAEIYTPEPSQWHNFAQPLDVNADGRITPLDALVVINHLNRTGGGRLPATAAGNQPPPYLDVRGTGSVGPLDVLVIVNHLNRNPPGDGEAPAAATDEPTEKFAGIAPPADYWSGIQTWSEELKKRNAARELVEATA